MKKIIALLTAGVLLLGGCADNSGTVSESSSLSAENVSSYFANSDNNENSAEHSESEDITISESSSSISESSSSPFSENSDNGGQPADKKISELTTMELVREMGYGINLGNTFESCGDWINSDNVSAYETAWGSPIITREAIQGYADAGFGVLRIPVAWSNVMSNDGNYTISPEYTARIHEVVGWTLDAGMFAIINIHWDGGWVNTFPENEEENIRRFSLMWKQIAEAFNDFDERLMFEAQNEELGWESIWNKWSGSAGDDKRRSYDLVNRINQAFVDVVRGTGGNNFSRHLLISGYNTDVELTCDELFGLPSDPAGRLAVSVHYYDPSTLTVLEQDADWGKAKTDWNSADIAELERKAALLKKRFIDNGIPVIVGEYGCFGKNKAREVIESYLLDVSSRMYAIGACPILWDTCNDEYDRSLNTFRRPEFIKRLLGAS